MVTTGTFNRFNHAPAIVKGVSRRHLNSYVLAVLHSGNGHFSMQLPRCAHHHKVDIVSTNNIHPSILTARYEVNSARLNGHYLFFAMFGFGGVNVAQYGNVGHFLPNHVLEHVNQRAAAVSHTDDRNADRLNGRGGQIRC